MLFIFIKYFSILIITGKLLKPGQTMSKIYKVLLIVVTFTLLTEASKAQPLALQSAFPNLSFSGRQPIFLTHSKDNTNRIFVVEKGGFIRVFPNDSTVTSMNTFLNITNKIVTGSGGDERGLLGLAFHPNYASNGYFYVNYTRTGDGATVISRFTRSSGNPNKADSLSELILLTIAQPFSNHNGGMLLFGLDGYMYIGMGDGGSGGDPGNRAQNPNELLGKILRINVDTTIGSQNYGIPPTNPFVSGGGRPEIYTLGMRNPWRFTQDPVTGVIYAADVGQESWEEISIIENGKNYGWRCYEGTHAYNTSGCGPISNYIFPIKEYSSQTGSGNCSVTGGHVYRGSRRPELVGRYIYGDYCSRRIWKLLYNSGNVSDTAQILSTTTNILAFGMDQFNELYVCCNDFIYRFNTNTSSGIGDPEITPESFVLKQNYPNPFNPETFIGYSVPELSKVSLVIYNAAGEAVRNLVNTTQLAGNYNISWNGQDDYGRQLPSGVYFYSLTSGSFKDSKKMVLVK
jgi:glucose/arabinose dehydrogenase